MSGVVTGEQSDVDIPSVRSDRPWWRCCRYWFGQCVSVCSMSENVIGCLKLLYLLFPGKFWLPFHQYLQIWVGKWPGEVVLCTLNAHDVCTHILCFTTDGLRSVVWCFQEFKIKKQWHPGSLQSFICCLVGFAYLCSV